MAAGHIFHFKIAKPCVSLAQTVFRLAVYFYLESDCQTMWFIWLKLFLDWRQRTAINSWRSFRAYEPKQI